MSERILGKGSQPVKGSSEAEEKLRRRTLRAGRRRDARNVGTNGWPRADSGRACVVLLSAGGMGRVLPLEQLGRI